MMESDNQESGPESNKYAGLSQWCIGEADGYLRRRNNIQASEKGWGAAAQALKAIAERRGWNHHTHGLIMDIVNQVAEEQGRPDLVAMFGRAQALHTNFYENWLDFDTIGIYLNAVKTLLAELDLIRAEPTPPAFVPETDAQRNRWRRLTRAHPIRRSP